MENITEKDHLEKEWYEQAKEQTLETLPTFIKHVMNDYSHDYGTIVKAMNACAQAALRVANKEEQGGITGFQAGAIMWEFILEWNHKNNKTGMKLLDYDNMLYPQYEYLYEKEISKNVFEALQKEAKNVLENDNKYLHPEVKKHMESIVNGIVPFGYSIKD